MSARILVVDRDGALAALFGDAWAEGEGPEVHRLARAERLLEVLADGGYALLVAGAGELRRDGGVRIAEAQRRGLVGAVLRVGGADGELPEDVTAAEARQAVEAALATPRRGRVTAIIGVSGGAGRTTVALALADLVAAAGERAVVVDASLQFGAVGPALDRTVRRSITEVLYDERGRAQDDDTVAETLADLAAGARPAADGFAVLAAPTDPVDADRIAPEHLARTVALLAHSLDRVVVDTPAGLGPETLAVLDEADDVVVVATLDVPGMAALRTVDALLDALGIPAPARHLVLNKELEGTGLPGRQAAETLGRPVAGVIPFDTEVVRARNHGRAATAMAGPAAEALRAALTAVAPVIAVAGPGTAPVTPAGGTRDRLRAWAKASAAVPAPVSGKVSP